MTATAAATTLPSSTTERLETPLPAAVAGPLPYHITIEFYRRLVTSGFIGEHEPVYLWRGRLVQKMTKGRVHNNRCACLTMRLVPLLPVSGHVRVEQPVFLPNDGAPEPDFSIVRGAQADYEQRDVWARDVGLIVEVADSSLLTDRGETLEDYARYGLPVYWIVNIPDHTIDVYTEPSGERDSGPPYDALRRGYGVGEEVPVILDGMEVGRIPVREVLP